MIFGSKKNSVDLGISIDKSKQEIAEIMIGNDCIVVWLGESRQDTFYDWAKRSLQLNKTNKEQDLREAILKEHTGELMNFKEKIADLEGEKLKL